MSHFFITINIYNIFKSILILFSVQPLITQCTENKRNAFINNLKLLLNSGDNHFKLVLTVRADFEPQFYGSDLAPYWQHARYTVPLFKTEELREVIVKPAIQEVMQIEPPQLVDRIIDEVIQSPGSLSLLSFTLSELYRMYIASNRSDRTLKEADYISLGGVIGALGSRADSLLENLNEEYRNSLRKIMLRMISLEGVELTSKRLLIKDLDFSKDENYRIEDIVDQLLEARLIIKGKDENDQIFIEPAHEALIKGWETLWNWVNSQGEDNIILQNRLAEAIKDYNSGNATLWDNDPRLDQLQTDLISSDSWLNKNEKSFIRESIKLKKRKKNRFIISITGNVITFVLIFVFTLTLEIPKWILYTILATPTFFIFGIAVYYLSLLFHPLTIKLSQDSLNLIRLPMEQLAKAYYLLKKTRKLNNILSDCDLDITILEETISIYERKNIHEMATILINRIGEKISTYEKQLFRIDKIKLSNEFVLDINECFLAFPPEILQSETIMEELKKNEDIDYITCIIISTNAEQWRKLKKETGDLTNRFVTMGSRDITEWLLSSNSVKVVSRIISSQVSFFMMLPYQAQGGLDKESLFFGRDQEISRVLGGKSTNYFLIGGRQVGKSSLLKQIQRKFKERAKEIECFLLTGGEKDIIQQLADSLDIQNTGIKDIIGGILHLSVNTFSETS